ncbi:hypothetical protein Godav_018569 [Gossypium davidsonii]|uniref:Uncharacterized protein n=1 Tax=Gossypium davidsonii TaxID=34287 RepID=A0A7J8QY59_GOSDV|nr:hypothetical protein [Gossypium davidsonii]
MDEAASPEAAGTLTYVSRVETLIEKFKSSVGDDSESVDGTTSALADEVAASPESQEEIATEVSSGLLKMENGNSNPSNGLVGLCVFFVVGQNEKAIDEAASPEAVGVFRALVMAGIISKLQDDGIQNVDGTTSALADEVAASPESEEEIATEVSSGLLKMENDKFA